MDSGTVETADTCYGCHDLVHSGVPQVFNSCAGLKGVLLNEGLRTISSHTFESNALETVTFPTSVKKIDSVRSITADPGTLCLKPEQAESR